MIRVASLEGEFLSCSISILSDPWNRCHVSHQTATRFTAIRNQSSRPFRYFSNHKSSTPENRNCLLSPQIHMDCRTAICILFASLILCDSLAKLCIYKPNVKFFSCILKNSSDFRVEFSNEKLQKNILSWLFETNQCKSIVIFTWEMTGCIF